MTIFSKLARFNKLWVALVGAGVLAAHGYMDDNVLTFTERVQIGSAVVGAFLVWLTANGPKGTFWYYAKTAAYGVSAVLALLVTTLPDGLSAQEKIDLVIAFATGAGILSASNKPEPAPGPESVTVH